MALPTHTRRWPRYPVELSVRIFSVTPTTQVAVPGLVTELSQGGMSICAGLRADPGDIAEIEFCTPPMRVTGVIRSRDGFSFGLEFLAVWKMGDPPERVPSNGVAAIKSSVNTLDLPEAGKQSIALFLKRHYDFLRKKQQEAKRLESEVAALRLAVAMLQSESSHR